MMRLLYGCMIAVALAVPAQAETWRDKVTAFANENFHHPAWGASHARRDYALAKSLAVADGVTLDDDVLFAASLLHDMSAFASWKVAGLDHSDAAAQKIDAVLGGTDFPHPKLEAVRAAIRTHMYYRDPVSAEAKYLHDADALDWLGAIGIARQTALVSKDGAGMQGKGAIEALTQDMTAVPPRIVTPAGKALIAPRLAEENAFLDALKRESGDLADL